MAKQPRKSTEPASQKPLPKGRTVVKDAGPGLEDPRVLRPGPGDPTQDLDLEADLEVLKKPAAPSELRIRKQVRRSGN
jgi:hypothetical protein